MYKGEDAGHSAAEHAARRLQSLIPVALNLSDLAWSPSRQRQSYVIAETEEALYVSFLGTKRPLDIMASLDMKGTTDDYLQALGPGAIAHKGYASRAAAVPVEQLWRLANVRGRRLVLCGHSMGGAVAQLCALRLLTQLPEQLQSTVQAIGFATPPLGSASVAAAVVARGWDTNVKNYLLPEDWVPGALNLWKTHAQHRLHLGRTTTIECGFQSTVVTHVGTVAAAAGSSSVHVGAKTTTSSTDTTSSTSSTVSPPPPSSEGGLASDNSSDAVADKTARYATLSVKSDYYFCRGYKRKGISDNEPAYGVFDLEASAVAACA